MKALLKRWVALILVSSTLIQLLAGCSRNQSSDLPLKTRFEEEIIAEQFITETEIDETKLEESYITENLIYEDGIYEYKVSENIISQSYIFETTITDHTEEQIIAQLPAELNEYDIDWPKVIGKFAVGTTIIIAVGIVNHFSVGSTYFVFGSPATVARDAFIGGAIGAAINEVIECVREGKAPQKAIAKYAIEGFAAGYMWGAISSVLKVSTENFKRLKEFKLATGGTATIRPDGSVFDDAGKMIGQAFYHKDGFWYLLDDTSSTMSIQIFNKAGKAITDSTILSKIKTLPPNAMLRLGPSPDAVICYTDDLGQLIRIGDDLMPNLFYTLNGYTYFTDDFGRISSVVFNDLKLKTENQGRLLIKDTINDIGKSFEKPMDDRGHLIADMFGGNNTMANIVPMDLSVNRGEVKAIELSWQKCLQSGGHIHGRIDLSYVGESFRPDYFKYTYSTGEEEITTIVTNGIL